MKITGIFGVSSFKFDSWIILVCVFQRAPSINSPCTYEPSRGGLLKSSRFFFVTSHCRHILSRGHSFLRAIDCKIAVRKDWGLKNPASQIHEGMPKSDTQLSNSQILWRRSTYQAARPFIEGYRHVLSSSRGQCWGKGHSPDSPYRPWWSVHPKQKTDNDYSL